MDSNSISDLNQMLDANNIPPEAVSAVIWWIAPRLTTALSSWWKKRYNTTGVTTKNVVKVMSALTTIALGFGTQAYSLDSRGILNCIFAGILTYIRTVGEYDRDVQVRVKAEKTINEQNGENGILRDLPEGSWEIRQLP